MGGEIAKTETDKIVVSRKTFDGQEYVDIRMYFKNKAGDWIATKKGIVVGQSKLNTLIALLQEEAAGKWKPIEKSKTAGDGSVD